MTVLVTLDAFEQLEALPNTIRRRIRTILGRLRRWPAVSGAKPLAGEVLVTRIGHRDGFYED